jgi:hypothetical protein
MQNPILEPEADGIVRVDKFEKEAVNVIQGCYHALLLQLHLTALQGNLESLTAQLRLFAYISNFRCFISPRFNYQLGDCHTERTNYASSTCWCNNPHVIRTT